MSSPKKTTSYALVILLSVGILSYAYMHRYTYSEKNTIEVKGIGSKNFKSNLIVWEGSFYTTNETLQGAYAELKKHQDIVKSFLLGKGVAEKEMVFGAVETDKRSESIYNNDGRRIGSRFLGYRLSQDVTIESSELEKVEMVSRSITEVLNQGLEFYSKSPRYYFNELDNLKHDLISLATEDAKNRAEIIAEKAGASIGDLKSADMGVFQIVGQNSTDEYSWGGTYNTSSKYKTASVTMDLTYEINN
ncbi:MAG: SIMPL domain-containing protein [Bacteroidia bacterium]|jgi:hypothetical protein|nr:SIMPL domain-containing protein [Bacteroidia bacterium]